MKNKEMILKAIKHLSNCEQSDDNDFILDLLRRFLISNEPAPAGNFNIFNYVGKDKINQIFNGVLYQDGKMIASDKYILIALDGVVYNSDYEGKVLDKQYTEIDGGYPNWKNVIPDCSNAKSWRIDREPISEIVKAEKVRKQECGERTCIIVINGVALDAKKILLLIDFAKHIGVNEILTNGAEKSVVVKSGESVGVLFPRFINNYESHESDDILVVNLTPDFIQ